MVRTFNSAKSVIQFQDKEAGKIIGKYLMYSIATGQQDVYSMITISVKDNAAKIDIEPMDSWKYDSSGMTLFSYSEEKAQKEINILMQDFESYLKQAKADW